MVACLHSCMHACMSRGVCSSAGAGHGHAHTHTHRIYVHSINHRPTNTHRRTTAENPLMESSEEQNLATEIEGLLAAVR